ncbi:MAG: CRISPR-associated ring nuclease Csm6 [Thermodesulfovibrionales bacterium]|nr:CRISPR-associated ring nuclease Csm6 [Thermodesulfovibrionales bacterium]
MKQNKFKEILIFVAGATPQIITETLYGLSQRDPPIFPDEIYIITTSIGKKHIEDTLINKGILKGLISEYALPDIKLKEDSFVIVTDSKGNEIDDIREEEENEAMGDLITSFIKEKTKDPDVRLHCSLAGGRKTMSFYIGSALQLFGRPWDKLYHVLVTPEFESNPDFYYKPRKDKILKKDGKELYTKDAEIFLAQLPFIRLRDKIPLDGKSFRELVLEGQKEIDTATTQPFLTVNLKERTVYIGDTPIDMVPIQLMIYTAFLRQKIEHCKYPENAYCLNCTDCFLPIVDFLSRPALEKMSRDYRTIYSIQPGRADDLLDKCKEGLRMEILRSNISKINRTIKEQLMNDTLLPYYTITAIKQYAGSRYGIRVEKGKIKIV